MSMYEPQFDHRDETHVMQPEFLAERIRQISRLDAERVERALLTGGDRIEVASLFGHRHVYELPGWRQHPIARARVALARRRFRLRETR